MHNASSAPLSRLESIVRTAGLADMATQLGELSVWVRQEMSDFDQELKTVERGPRQVLAAAHHLLDMDGKHLRPMCVILAAKLGRGYSDETRQLAMTVELIHTATLLHDDVVDVAEQRRGLPTARVVYSNAASIFAGDWMLIDALQRLRTIRQDRLLDSMLSVIREMILAESLQLERRGRVHLADRESYFRVVEGKTAALFRWAFQAGAISGGLTEADEAALMRFGVHLGVAFQAIDDTLDYADAGATGKDAFLDLREGKLTYPLLLALEAEPGLAAHLTAMLEAANGNGVDPAQAAHIIDTVHRTGGIGRTRELAETRVDAALRELDRFPAGAARDALITVARASLGRTK